MDSSKAKIAGPAIAVGAVSIGLVVLGACGVGQHDIYVPPPPLKAGQPADPAARTSSPEPSTATVIIPPSPSWKIAPYRRPPAPFEGFLTTTPTSAEPSTRIPHEDPSLSPLTR
ncbi:hypothetical protein ACL02S_08860 [Nocardia sp. 004]|uniref:hypothetical protein n=1 Tax=Nocardia sp. 004 TaxID=3385978 RepID=UPI0039A08F22